MAGIPSVQSLSSVSWKGRARARAGLEAGLARLRRRLPRREGCVNVSGGGRARCQGRSPVSDERERNAPDLAADAPSVLSKCGAARARPSIPMGSDPCLPCITRRGPRDAPALFNNPHRNSLAWKRNAPLVARSEGGGLWARARGWVPSPSDSPPRRVAPRQGWPRLGRAHPGASLSLSHSRSRNGTPSRGSATFLNNACVHIILFKSHLERESSILQPCAPEFCWKTLQNISPSGRGQVQRGRPHRAGVRRAAKRQRESLRSLTGRREEDPRPTDRISAATRASYFGERSSLPALPRVRSRGEPKGHLWGSVFFLERGLDGEQPR